MTTTKIALPTDLNEIPLITFLEYQKLPQEMDSFERALRAVSIFSGLPYRSVLKMPLNILEMAAETIADTLSQEPQFQNQWIHDGIRYGFVPNLDDLSTGEFVDIDNYLKNPQDLYKALSVLYRPIIRRSLGTYEIEPYKGQVVESFRQMPTGIALGSQLFFYTIGIDLLNYTLRSLENLRTNPSLSNNNLSQQNTDGLDSSISLLMEMSSNLIRLRLCPFIRPYCGPLTNRILRNLREKSLSEKPN